MQLVAYGAQDVYLTGNPQITFFKVVYRRHTNFAIEAIEETFNGAVNFGRKVSCPIIRNGDLVTKMYLKLHLPALDVSSDTTFAANGGGLIAWGPQIGVNVIESVELNIGGSRIDKHWGDWLSIWHELTRQPGQDAGYAQMIGNTSALTSLAPTIPATQLFVPLMFFHCRNDGLALPLIALQYHDVRVDFEFKNVNQCVIVNDAVTTPITGLGISFQDCTLLVNYIYLDSEERKRFAQASHEYLIEQLQYTGEEAISNPNQKYRLNFNHPCKELVWACRFGRWTSNQDFLAWNPNDTAAMVDLATRRFVQSVAAIRDTTAVSAGDSPTTGQARILTVSNVDSRVLGSPQFATTNNTTLATVFANLSSQVIGPINGSTAVAPVSVGTGNPAIFMPAANSPNDVNNPWYGVNSATFNDITYEQSLPLRYVSMPTSMIFTGFIPSTYSSVTRAITYAGSNVQVVDLNNHALNIDHTVNPLQGAILQLNGQERFSWQPGSYFNYVQPWEAHSATPSDGVNVYSFGLNPEDHQPSGTCNFSRIDNAQLNVQFYNPDPAGAATFQTEYLTADSILAIYGTNYNVLRIMSGMGGLAYSN